MKRSASLERCVGRAAIALAMSVGVLACCPRPAPIFNEDHAPLEEIEGIWISRSEIMALPMEGPAWAAVVRQAAESTRSPNLSNRDDMTNVRVLAKALVFVRTRQASYRDDVIAACMDAIGTEKRGNALCPLASSRPMSSQRPWWGCHLSRTRAFAVGSLPA